LLIYSNIFDNSTHFDDEFIFKNPNLHNPNNLDSLASINKFRVVPFWTFAYNYVSSNNGKDLSGFYTFNIIIHIINSLLVFGIVFLIFKTPVIKESKISGYGVLFAFLAAMMFVAHPLQTQAVTYIYQRLASLAATFYFGAVFAYLLARLSKSGILVKSIFYVLSLVCLILGLFSKENVFTIFPMILVIELMLFNKNFKLSPVVIGVFLGLIALGMFIFLQFQVFSNIFAPLENFNGETITSQSYLLTQLKVIPLYFKLFLVPFGQNFDHDIRVSNSLADGGVILGLVIIAIIIGFALYMYKYNRLITFGIIWTFLTIAVESSVIPIADVVFEHRVYLPMLGLILALIGILYEIFSRKEQLIPFMFLILFLLVGMDAVLANQRNNVWNSELTLWSDVVKKSPNKARAYFKRGQANLIDGKVNWALSDFNKVISLRPEFISAYTYRAAIYISLNKLREALADQNKFLELSKDKTQAYLNRARTYVKMKSYGKALEDYTKYLKTNNQDVTVLLEKAGIHEVINDAVNAVSTTKQALKIDPNNPESQFNLGRYYFMTAKFDSSMILLDKVQNTPNVPSGLVSNVHNIKGNYYFYLKDYAKSIEEYKKAIDLNKNFMNGLVNLAIVYRATAQYEKELEIINQIIKLDPRNDINWQVRGFCNVNLKNYKEADKDLRRAIELNRTNREANIKLAEIQQYLN
jgi:tetratricopeptide (TPR) repeat protein